MSAHLRLAERQGLLQGRHISPVQSYALTILNYLDEIEKVKNRTEAFKYALLSRDQYDPKKMFPEYFSEQPAKEDTGSGHPDAVEPDDYSNVEWKSPKDAAEEWERISQMLGQNHGALTGDEVTGAPVGDIEWTEWR